MTLTQEKCHNHKIKRRKNKQTKKNKCELTCVKLTCAPIIKWTTFYWPCGLFMGCDLRLQHKGLQSPQVSSKVSLKELSLPPSGRAMTVRGSLSGAGGMVEDDLRHHRRALHCNQIPLKVADRRQGSSFISHLGCQDPCGPTMDSFSMIDEEEQSRGDHSLAAVQGSTGLADILYSLSPTKANTKLFFCLLIHHTLSKEKILHRKKNVWIKCLTFIACPEKC